MLFALHPISHENVIWISGRTFLIAAAFYLALLLWTSTHAGRGPMLQHGVGLLLLGGALGSYEASVTLPLAVLVVWVGVQSSKRLVTEVVSFLAPYALLLGAYALFRWVYLSGFRADAVTLFSNVDPLWRRAIVNCALLGLRLLLVHPFPALNVMGLVSAAVTISLAILSLVCGYQSHRVRPLVIGACVLGLVGFLPFVPYISYTDRFAYLSAAAFAAMLGFGCGAGIVLGGMRRATTMILIVAAGATWSRDLYARGMEWRKSGQLAESLLDQLIELEPAPPEGTRLHFLGVPNYYGRAVLFLTYFDYSVHARYGFQPFVVVIHDASTLTPELLEQLRTENRAVASTAARPRLFRWDAPTERLVRVNIPDSDAFTP